MTAFYICISLGYLILIHRIFRLHKLLNKQQSILRKQMDTLNLATDTLKQCMERK